MKQSLSFISLSLMVLSATACLAEESVILHHFTPVSFALAEYARGSKILSLYSDANTTVTDQGCSRDACNIEITSASNVPYGVVSVIVGHDATHNCRIELIDGYRFQFPNYYTIPKCQGGFRVEGPVIGNAVSGYNLQIISDHQ